ncbi:DegT/DnrJ/EryC1/StrS aminotransferase family protein [Candidatus Micrarchaeota archaeon]|nr:DegT/DnrJ/EryC1/StrS aminotransferase family protein [Candidatus Micrarchaeota archaeon]
MSGIPIAKPIIGDEEVNHAMQVLRSGQLTHGPKVEEFEKALAQYCQYKHAIALNSGTAALHVALLAAGIKEKDEVLIPDFSFIATANVTKYVRAKTKYIDVDKKTFNMNPDKTVKELKKGKAKAVIPVSLYGQAYDVDAIVDAAHAAGAKVISDNCQAIGAKWKGSRNFNDDAACLSFYPTKNMTTMEGGAILTDNDELAANARIIRNVGMRARYEYLFVGYNYRMTGVGAAIGLEQLKKLDGWTEKRRKNAEMLNDLLKKVKQVKTPFCDERAFHVYHQYTLKAENRDGLKAHLDAAGIGNAVFYPTPLHSIPVLEAKGSCPTTEKICKEVLSLPVHPSLSEEDVHKVAESVTAFYAEA